MNEQLRSGTMPSGGGWKTGGDTAGTAAARVGGWLDRIPGYRGYRAKEDRRDADRRVRDAVAAELSARAARVETVARELANKRRLAEIGPVDELARSIRHLADRVRTASYGYGGLFSDRDVDEAALDQLKLFDQALLNGVTDLDAPIAALEAVFASGGDLAAAAGGALAAVKTLHTRLDVRDRVIETGAAAPQATVEAILQPAVELPPPPAYDLGRGDAIAVLGDDYIVDARIDVVGPNHAFRLYRVGEGEPERWLFVARDVGLGLAMLTSSGPAASGSDAPAFEGDEFVETAAGSGDGEISSADRASGRRPVNFRLLKGKEDEARRAVVLDWNGEVQTYVGQQVHPADVEVFGGARS
jgi:hypothetical protein